MLLAFLLAIFLLIIMIALVKALFAMTRGDASSMYQDLFWRMAFTVGLLMLLVLGWYLGLWQPRSAYGPR